MNSPKAGALRDIPGTVPGVDSFFGFVLALMQVKVCTVQAHQIDFLFALFGRVLFAAAITAAQIVVNLFAIVSKVTESTAPFALSDWELLKDRAVLGSDVDSLQLH